LDRVFEVMVWLVVAPIVGFGVVLALALALSLVLPPLVLQSFPPEATACAAVGVVLLCLPFVRPMLVKKRWWKEVVWSAVGAGIGAILAELALWIFLTVSGTQLLPEAGQGILVILIAPLPVGLLLGGIGGFWLSRVVAKRAQ
jgi:hypothetical protein